MDFRYSTEQDDFRASLSGFLRDSAAPLGCEVREAAGHDPRSGNACAASWSCRDCTSRASTAERAATLVETAIVFSELGRALTPVPLAATTFAIEAVFRTGDEEQRRRLLKGLLCGEQIGAFAVAGPDDTDPPRRRCGRTGTAAAPCSPARAVPFCTVTSRTCSSCLRWPTVWSPSTLWRPTPPGSPS